MKFSTVLIVCFCFYSSVLCQPVPQGKNEKVDGYGMVSGATGALSGASSFKLPNAVSPFGMASGTAQTISAAKAGDNYGMVSGATGILGAASSYKYPKAVAPLGKVAGTAQTISAAKAGDGYGMISGVTGIGAASSYKKHPAVAATLLTVSGGTQMLSASKVGNPAISTSSPSLSKPMKDLRHAQNLSLNSPSLPQQSLTTAITQIRKDYPIRQYGQNNQAYPYTGPN